LSRLLTRALRVLTIDDDDVVEAAITNEHSISSTNKVTIEEMKFLEENVSLNAFK